MRNVSELIGKTVVKIEKVQTWALYFYTSGGECYVMYHGQECCENVDLIDVVGDFNDLIGTPILKAEAISNYTPQTEEEAEKLRKGNDWGVAEYTFYKFATIKGYVDLRWFGESNGYYSTSVDFILNGTDTTMRPWGKGVIIETFQ